VKFGGSLAVEDFVDKVYNEMKEDPALKTFFGQSAGRAFNLQVLKDRTVDYLCSDAQGAWGNDPYHGPELFASHSALNITMKQYDVFMKCTKLILKQKKTASAIQKEVIRTFEEMRDPICDPNGSHMKKLKDGLEAAQKACDAQEGNDYDPTGFGMTTSRETAKLWAAKEARTKELKEKMDNLKKERAAKAKAEAAAAKAAPKPKAKPKAKSTSKSPAPSKGKAKAAPKKVLNPKENDAMTEKEGQPDQDDEKKEDIKVESKDVKQEDLGETQITDKIEEVKEVDGDDTVATSSREEPEPQPEVLSKQADIATVEVAEETMAETQPKIRKYKLDPEDDMQLVRNNDDLAVVVDVQRKCECWGF